MQEQEGQDLQSEAPAPPFEKEAEVPLGQDIEVTEPTAAPRRLRRILLWALSLIVILAAGVILTWVIRVKPQAEQIASLDAAIITLQDQVDEQSQELKELRPLVAQNDKLESELALSNAHLDLLTVLVDVTTAQLALAQEDDIAARAALTGTGERLEALETSLEGTNAVEVREMNDRLQLVIAEVQSDAFAARRDLEILTNNLLALERVLFGE